jgi:hypothetical protein
MSKIEIYKKAKSSAEDMRSFANQVIDDRKVDKFGMDFSITNTWMGYYGNSSTYAWHEEIKNEMAYEIKRSLRAIAQSAAKRLEEAAEQYRIAAQAEAREVLAQVEK